MVYSDCLHRLEPAAAIGRLARVVLEIVADLLGTLLVAVEKLGFATLFVELLVFRCAFG